MINLNTDMMALWASRGSGKTYQQLASLQQADPGRQPAGPAETPDHAVRLGGGARFTAAIRETNETVAAVEQADENLSQIQDLLGKMQQLARKVESGEVTGQLPEMPDDPAAYEQVMADLAAQAEAETAASGDPEAPAPAPEGSAPDTSGQAAPAVGADVTTADPVAEETDAVYESLSVEKPSIAMVAKDFGDMASKISKLLDDTLAADRNLLRDQVHSGVDDPYASLDEIRLSNVISGTLEQIDSAVTTTLEARKELDATRRVAEHEAITLTEEVRADSQAAMTVPDSVPAAEELAEKVSKFFESEKGQDLLAAQANPGPRMAADLLANMFT